MGFFFFLQFIKLFPHGHTLRQITSFFSVNESDTELKIWKIICKSWWGCAGAKQVSDGALAPPLWADDFKDKPLQQNESFIMLQKSSTAYQHLTITITVSWAANHHIKMGSCDTEDWSYDAENSALHRRNKCSRQCQIFSYYNIKAFLRPWTHRILQQLVYPRKVSSHDPTGSRSRHRTGDERGQLPDSSINVWIKRSTSNRLPPSVPISSIQALGINKRMLCKIYL